MARFPNPARARVRPWRRAIAAATLVLVLVPALPMLAPTLVPTLAPTLRAAPLPERVAGVARVVDGDTVEIAGVTVRLLHIDAPETGQTCGSAPCGVTATAHLAGLIAGRAVVCVGDTRDAYGRLLAVCHAGGRDLNRAMVADGHAMVFRRYGDAYDADERAARAARRGLWAHGDPTPPWDFRARRWQAAGSAAPRADCPIKGNISADGDRIYHTPYSQWYDRTRIDPARGERWFCDEAAARAAGWRAPYGS